MIAGARVLVADDDPELLSTVTKLLTRWGSRVTAARNGAELMTHLAEPEPYDLVVADISMPLSSGLQAAHSARDVGVDTPVIVTTALSDPQLEARVKALGPKVALLRKPFTAEALEEAAALLLHEEGPAAQP